MTRRYWAHPFGLTESKVGPFDTLEEAVRTAFATYPDANEVTTGYGTYGPHFDIRWIKRRDLKVVVAETLQAYEELMDALDAQGPNYVAAECDKVNRLCNELRDHHGVDVPGEE